MMEYNWPGNIRELENLVKRYVIVGNEAQIIRELSTHKPIDSSDLPASWESEAGQPTSRPKAGATDAIPISDGKPAANECPSLLEIGRAPPMRPSARPSSGC